MVFRAAFIFLAPDVNPEVHRSKVMTPEVELTTVAVCDYAEAEKVAKSLVAQGIKAIELCGGFGNSGTARIAAAIDGKADIGVVRFDCHPGLEGKSGDLLFGGE